MKTRAGKLLDALLLVSLLLLTSCATLSIDPPSPEKQSLLVLPATLTRNAQSARFGFSYVYTITSDDNQLPPYKATFKFPVEGDMLIVDTLPPGDYRVASLTVVPVGTGDRHYEDNAWPINQKFTLSPGEVTLLNKSMNLLTYNEIPGRGGETTYRWSVQPVTAAQRQLVLDRLAKLPNFGSWKLQDPNGLRASGAWSGSWEPVGAQDCSSGELSIEVSGSEITGNGVSSAAGESLALAATMDNQGLVTGKLSDAGGPVASVSGQLYRGGEIVGFITYYDGCKVRWNVLKNP